VVSRFPPPPGRGRHTGGYGWQAKPWVWVAAATVVLLLLLVWWYRRRPPRRWTLERLDGKVLLSDSGMGRLHYRGSESWGELPAVQEARELLTGAGIERAWVSFEDRFHVKDGNRIKGEVHLHFTVDARGQVQVRVKEAEQEK